jgi:pseudaminic acid biosynthesis-associated methylase
MSDVLDFWKGDFGDEYTDRCQGDKLVFNNTMLFRRALTSIFFTQPKRVLEFGANAGLNIRALRDITPFSQCEFTAVEPNGKAAAMLCNQNITVHNTSMQDADAPWGGGYDLVLCKGVLIHVEPAELPRAYGAIYRAARRYVFIAEYHNPVPVEVPYRGHAGRLWKRDFAGEMLDMFPGLEVRNVGFAWKRDPVAPQDDLVWTLLEKVA